MWSGALATAGDVVFYGTLEGYLKAVDAKTGKELYKFKTPSGIIGNVMTYEHDGKQYIAVLSGVGGWAGIGLAAGSTDPTAGLGAVGGYAALQQLHGARRTADRVRPAATEPGRPTEPHRLRRAERSAPGRPSVTKLHPQDRSRAYPFGGDADRCDHGVACRLCCCIAVPRRAIRQPVKNEDGKYFDKDGNPDLQDRSPTARSTGTPIRASAAITRNATSAMAPTARARPMRRRCKDSLKTMSYAEFLEVVVNGRQKCQRGASSSVMPSFGTNRTSCVISTIIYVYLRARADDALGRGRPAKREAKPQPSTRPKRSVSASRSQRAELVDE